MMSLSIEKITTDTSVAIGIMANVRLACNDHKKVLHSGIMPLFTADQEYELTDYLKREPAGRYTRANAEFAMDPPGISLVDFSNNIGLTLLVEENGWFPNIGAHDHGRYLLRENELVLYGRLAKMKLFTESYRLVTEPTPYDYFTNTSEAKLRIREYNDSLLDAKRATAELIYPMLRGLIPQSAVVYTYDREPTKGLISYSPTE